MRKIDPMYSEHLFRPVFELNAAFVWLLGAICTPIISILYTGSVSLTLSLTIAVVMFLVSAHYVRKSWPLLSRQLRLTTNKKIFMSVARLRAKNQLAQRNSSDSKERKKDERRTYIGEGFVWGPEHANRAYQVMDMSTDFSQVKLPFFLKPVAKALSEQTEDLGGAPWVHGMGDEVEQKPKESNWYGHTCITGNVGTGKTTLLRLMSLNSLHLGNMLLVLDPKNDHDWQESIKSELEYLGKGDKFYHLHPSSPSTSVRIPLLTNYTRLTEVAARIAPLMGGDGSGKAFQDFAYDVIYSTTVGLDYLGEPVRLTSIGKVIKSDRRGLALRVLDKFFSRVMGDEYRSKIGAELAEMSGDLLEGLAQYYLAHSKEFPGKTINGEVMGPSEGKAVEAMISFALHDDGHYQKMISTLKPVFTALTADPLDDLFSPIHENNIDDPREIIDLAEVMETGGCLYISLDSMTDGVTASFLSRLLLAEACAVAGSRYNQKDKDPLRITIANDEVHASIENNDSLFNMMAQGRAASVEMLLATQTISDIASKTDKASADRFLGLCNNFISMRTTDPITQKYVSEQFAKASVVQQQVRTGTARDTGKSTLAFSTGHQETLMKTREEAFPPSLLGDLPILQYVARLADGKKLKMRLPIIINNDKPDEVAPWVE